MGQGSYRSRGPWTATVYLRILAQFVFTPGVLGVLARGIPDSQVFSSAARGDVPWLAVGRYVIALFAAMLFTLPQVRMLEDWVACSAPPSTATGSNAGSWFSGHSGPGSP